MTNLSWPEIKELTKELADKIKASGFEPDCLVGIAVGGLVPLALLAEKLNISNVAVISANSYQERQRGEITVTCQPRINLANQKVLLIDEIIDSGETLKYISGLLIKQYQVGELKTAALIVNEKNCNFWPKLFILKTKDWVIFPWESNPRPTS